MYLAGLMADGSKMSKKELQAWVNKANSPTISEYTVAWVTSEHPNGFGLALEWIDSKKEPVAACGWSTLTSILATRPNEELDMKVIKSLLDRVQKTIHSSANRVRYAMNGFLIATGSFIPAMTATALDTGKKIGTVMVDMNGTACKVPSALDYIQKVKDKGYIGKKKKTAKC